MLQAVKGFQKGDLKVVAEELGETIPDKFTVVVLKDIILNSDEYKRDPDFVIQLLHTTIADRKEKEKNQNDQEFELKKLEAQKEKDKNDQELEFKRLEIQKELELAKLQIQNQIPLEYNQDIGENNYAKHKFTLPKLEFRQFDGEVKDWLPFWSQFKQIHTDLTIAPENKFQYLIQATVAGSRAREVVDSFPPTGLNYEKAIESLKTRFGREDLQVEVYVRELLKLIISVQTNEKLPLPSLYDKLESYLRALETLGVTTDKCASILYPMVESCFPAEFLRAWNRTHTISASSDAKERLDCLMDFLKGEVEGDERIKLAVAGFGLGKKEDDKPKRNKGYFDMSRGPPTATALLTSTKPVFRKNCVFCNGKHLSTECFLARKMSFAEKQSILKEKRCCFICLSTGHSYKNCKAIVKCFMCEKKHPTVMCPLLDKSKNSNVKKENESDITMTNFNGNPKVFLQTLKAKIFSGEKSKKVRLILDTGSQRSYILKSLAKEMNYLPLRDDKVTHSLFGGVVTKERDHHCYKIRLGDIRDRFKCNFDVWDQDIICESVMPVNKGSWLRELARKNITLSDVGEKPEPIQVLVGADIVGKLLTGRREVLSSGLVALETYLGWTLMGKVPPSEAPSNNVSQENLAISVTSLFINEAEIADLWKLDLLGISDPVEKRSKVESEQLVKEHFLQTVRQNEDGRYEISLPWAEDKPPLPDNLNLAKKRLINATNKIIEKKLYQDYEKVLLGWLEDNIIEEVPEAEKELYGNYLPHRPVIKETSSSTPLRPVFDASARIYGSPSLNQCLHCGPNLIELIPDLLLRFREKTYGVVADIKKAFLQIGIREEDRDVLRFLWWTDESRKSIRMFRHTRVVFGVKSSPFLLASVIEHHIKGAVTYPSELRQQLLKSFYVDNVVASLHTVEELREFVQDSKSLMAQGGFDLRAWEHTRDHESIQGNEVTAVLGLQWNRNLDVLGINMNWTKNVILEKITKRLMLSIAHKVFDPIGFTSPVMVLPKMMLQRTWKKGFNWDDEVDDDLKKEFIDWFSELEFLQSIQVPRYIHMTPVNFGNCSLHTFCDASKHAYAAVVFLRVVTEEQIQLYLLSSKSRICPLKSVTIPRMELLAALIGARLCKSVVDVLSWNNIEKYFWSDSTTVLTWISKDENWSVFVRNRVQEIRKLSDPSLWKHIPGKVNPADLPSKGCKAKKLVSLKWWEGPSWLKDPGEYYNYMNCTCPNINKEEIDEERSKSTRSLINMERSSENWYYERFSSYEKIVRVIGWILRFKNNSLKQRDKKDGELTSDEFQSAEMKVVWIMQREFFSDDNMDRLKTLETFKDDHDIMRVKTKITLRPDARDFLTPMIIPAKHEVTKRLILNFHVKNCHAGPQLLLNLLREKYWILNGRRTVMSVISKCTVCKRFNSKSLDSTPVSLPEDRVKDAAVFQIVGIDMAGPLFLKDNQKSWVIIFTCAVYRAVHLELVNSASTESFLMALRRFIARRGRCSIIYCDNGTNFVGASNALKKLDWNRLSRYGAVDAIQWKFNPPTAPWYGGWWERLIRLLKDLLKRVLGQACLTYEEMCTVLADCESIINSRPLTYTSEQEAISPISPSMFLKDIHEYSLPDIDAVERGCLSRRLKYRQNLLKDLRGRFRSEYLGLLLQRPNNKLSQRPILVGDIVLVGADSKKRIQWPLAKVTELIRGKDGKVRLAKLRTATHSSILRPVQRIYPLEVPTDTYADYSEPSRLVPVSPQRSRYGRLIKIPDRLEI